MDDLEYVYDGLPLHVLLVHVVVVAVPAVAVLLVVLAAWPAARRVLWVPALVAAALLVPLGLTTVEAGEWLQERVPEAPLIQEHTAQGEDLVPWLWALGGVAVLVAGWQVVTMVVRRRAHDADPDAAAPPSAVGRTTSVVVGVVLTLIAIAVAAGAIWTLVQIGESGSRAVWQGSFSETPLD